MKKIIWIVLVLILIVGIVVGIILYNNSKNPSQGTNVPTGVGTDLSVLGFDSATGQTNDTAVTVDTNTLDSTGLT